MLRTFVTLGLFGAFAVTSAFAAETAPASAPDEVGAVLDTEKKLSLGPAPGVQKIQTCGFVQNANHPFKSATVSCQAGKATVKLDHADIERLLTGMTIYQASCVDKNANELPDEDLKKTAGMNFEKDLAITLKEMCLKKFQDQFGFTPEKNVLIVRRPVTVDSGTNKPVNIAWACGIAQVKKFGRY